MFAEPEALLYFVAAIAGLAWLGARRVLATAPGHTRRTVSFGAAFGGALLAVIVWGAADLVSHVGEDSSARKLVDTVRLVLVAVGASTTIWVLANQLLSQASSRWRLFTTLSGALAVGSLAAVLAGNRALSDIGGGDGWEGLGTWAAFGALLGGAWGFAAGSVEVPLHRVVVGIAGGSVVGVVGGLAWAGELLPALSFAGLVAGPLIGAGVGAALSVGRSRRRRRRRPSHGDRGAAVSWPTWARSAALCAGIGAILGGVGLADLGGGSRVEAVLVALLVGALFGLWRGLTEMPDLAERLRLDERGRVVIFLGPALTFIAGALVIPTIRTIGLSLRDADSEGWVGFENYSSVFTDPKSLDLDDWSAVFGSRLLYVAGAVAILGLLVALWDGRQVRAGIHWGPNSLGPMVAAAVLLAFAVFSTVRGTIPNNLWWVVTVTLFSTGLGLAIAVLAERSRFEKVAKSIIFMPMAISFVGASIIWRFVYQARNAQNPQTGVMNALWVELGRLSTGHGIPTLIVSVASVVVVLGLAVALVRRLVARRSEGLFPIAAGLALTTWFTIRFLGDSGVGGVAVGEDGVADPTTILFVQEGPFNNFWLMVILIWIQTGFAMVILSAAIKAVPAELLEAAAVDGASDSDTFWNVTFPQILPTVGVVVTTLIVLVTKVFDIVKVITNGQFDTQVIANNMFNQAFQFGNTGVGAALAVILLISVLPVMVLNIRGMQKAKV